MSRRSASPPGQALPIWWSDTTVCGADAGASNSTPKARSAAGIGVKRKSDEFEKEPLTRRLSTTESSASGGASSVCLRNSHVSSICASIAKGRRRHPNGASRVFSLTRSTVGKASLPRRSQVHWNKSLSLAVAALRAILRTSPAAPCPAHSFTTVGWRCLRTRAFKEHAASARIIGLSPRLFEPRPREARPAHRAHLPAASRTCPALGTAQPPGSNARRRLTNERIQFRRFAVDPMAQINVCTRH